MTQTLSSRRHWRRELSVLLVQSATPATLSPAPCASCWPNRGRSGVMHYDDHGQTKYSFAMLKEKAWPDYDVEFTASSGITVFSGSTVAGYKVKAFVTCHSENPRAFQHTNNTRSQGTTETVRSAFLNCWANEMEKQCLEDHIPFKILLLVGVIAAFEAYHLSWPLPRLLLQLRKTLMQFWKNYNIYDCIKNLVWAWSDVTKKGLHSKHFLKLQITGNEMTLDKKAIMEAQGAGLRVAGVADWGSRTLSSGRHWRRELSVCAMAAPEAFGRPGAPAASRPAPPRSKAKAGELAGCLLRHKAFRKPPPHRRLSEGLVHRRTVSPLVHQIQNPFLNRRERISEHLGYSSDESSKRPLGMSWRPAGWDVPKPAFPPPSSSDVEAVGLAFFAAAQSCFGVSVNFATNPRRKPRGERLGAVDSQCFSHLKIALLGMRGGCMFS
ncbi:hypothetical protein QTO34_005416 [Cnephaeus nilssonii]|uniref:Uncharacterized protein n=1 Tax=Cnephaeus nilssonii TaxID=3371016 RepID=A0AA40LI46_CNENI|nr:hypothetical protein QTO34_005416 [Eptesicus nilssonii]